MAGENPKIGLDHVVIAKVLSDTKSGITFDTPIPLVGAVNATVNPNSDVAVDYADNGAFFVTNNRGNTEMTLEFTNVDPATLAAMLGQKRSGGITRETSMDQAPYYAMGFRVWIGGVDAQGNNIYEYFWFAKGKFSVPESGAQTKAESMNFQHVNMTAQFVSTQYIPGGETSGTICTHCRSDIDTSSGVISTWFNAPVVELSAQSNTITLASAVFADGKLTLTFSATSATTIAQSTVNDTNIVILDSNGDAVAGEFSEGTGASVSPTVIFTPDSKTPVTVTVSSGVKDIYNVSVTPKMETVA